jgi:hypothetical protein
MRFMVYRTMNADFFRSRVLMHHESAEGTCRRAQNALPVPRESAIFVPEAEHTRQRGARARSG